MLLSFNKITRNFGKIIMSPRRNESKKLSNVLFLKEKNFVLILLKQKKRKPVDFSLIGLALRISKCEKMIPDLIPARSKPKRFNNFATRQRKCFVFFKGGEMGPIRRIRELKTRKYF
jgi:hypothetical protein